MKRETVETIPVWDRLEGIPDPAENPILFGHRPALDRLAAMHAAGRLHHAILIGGPRGIGKATFAAQIAGHLLRYPVGAEAPERFVEPAAGDTTQSRIATGAHPNLIWLRRPYDEKNKRFRSELTIDEIRRARAFFASKAAGGGWRIAILDAADDLNANAANALLKILEEPPAQALLLVVAHSPQRMLPTIRSRCLKIALKPLEAEDMRRALSAIGVLEPDAEASDVDLALALAGGSVRRAAILLREDGAKLYRQFARLAANAREPDWSAIHAFASTLTGAAGEERYRLALDLIGDYVARRLRDQPEPGSDGKQANSGISLAAWVEVWEKTRHSAELADAYNLDRKQVFLNLFADLFEAMRTAA
jgi:DNA polymerase-3 subunit delta'